MQIVEFSYLGVRSAVLRLRHRGSSVRFVLYPMIHVADPSFYREVRERLAGCDVVVVEGVGSTAVTRGLTLTYRVLPRSSRSGLVEQPDLVEGLPVEVVRPDLTGPEFDASWGRMPWWWRLLLRLVLPWVVGWMALMSLLGGREWVLRQAMELELDDLPANQEVLYGAAHLRAVLVGLYALGYRVVGGDWLTVMART